MAYLIQSLEINSNRNMHIHKWRGSLPVFLMRLFSPRLIVMSVLGPDYMGTGWPGRLAGSFTEMEFRLVLYVKRAATRG